MRRACLILLVLSLTACGVQRPLIKPSEIPEYEANVQHKRDKIAQEQRELDQQNAADAAGRKMIEGAQ